MARIRTFQSSLERNLDIMEVPPGTKNASTAIDILQMEQRDLATSSMGQNQASQRRTPLRWIETGTTLAKKEVRY